MRDIREMPTFHHFVTKMVEEKVKEKIVLIPDAEHPLFEENNFGAASMNGELLSSQCLIGTTADEQVDTFQSISKFRFLLFNILSSSCDSASGGCSPHLTSSIRSYSSSLLSICPTFHYPSFGIDCNRLILHLCHMHSKYKWVYSIIFKSTFHFLFFDSDFGTGYINNWNEDDIFHVWDDADVFVDHIYDCSNLLRDVGYVPNPFLVHFSAAVDYQNIYADFIHAKLNKTNIRSTGLCHEISPRHIIFCRSNPFPNIDSLTTKPTDLFQGPSRSNIHVHTNGEFICNITLNIA